MYRVAIDLEYGCRIQLATKDNLNRSHYCREGQLEIKPYPTRLVSVVYPLYSISTVNRTVCAVDCDRPMSRSGLLWTDERDNVITGRGRGRTGLVNPVYVLGF